MRKKTATSATTADNAPTDRPAVPVVSAAGNPAPIAKRAGDGDLRVCAYLKWEAAGKHDGDGTQFWLEAEKELLQAK